jgi:hypothetical protein
MTESLEFKQSSHLNPQLSDPATHALNADKLVGRWLNTDSSTEGLSELVIEQDGARFSVSATGIGADGPVEWPKTAAKPLANLEEEGGQRTIALTAVFDFGFMTAETQIRVNKGVLVIVVFHTFRDDSGRASYVNREFFYRQG